MIRRAARLRERELARHGAIDLAARLLLLVEHGHAQAVTRRRSRRWRRRPGAQRWRPRLRCGLTAPSPSPPACRRPSPGPSTWRPSTATRHSWHTPIRQRPLAAYRARRCCDVPHPRGEQRRRHRLARKAAIARPSTVTVTAGRVTPCRCAASRSIALPGAILRPIRRAANRQPRFHQPGAHSGAPLEAEDGARLLGRRPRRRDRG